MSDEGFCIDALISPERSVTTYLHSLIEFPKPCRWWNSPKAASAS